MLTNLANLKIVIIIRNIFLQAQELSEAKRSTTAKLLITVKPVDANPPEIHLSAPEGYVNENSPIGEKILDAEGNPLVITVEDKDFVSR